VNLLNTGELSLLWSEIEWPLNSGNVQQNAVEFHRVISHILAQRAVVPFRLLTVFESEQSLATFAASHAADFVTDLDRLSDFVQMECILFFKMARATDTSSGQAYLRQKAELRHALDDYGAELKNALSPVAQEIHSKEVNNGLRIFCLVQRGKEPAFRESVSSIAVPQGLERRISGPWPASEFLSDAVKAPQMAELPPSQLAAQQEPK
jgi:Gas vesicle synthesis protein GvpL/GvpF